MTDAIRQQIDEKNLQMAELYRQGRYEDAVPIAVQVRELTRQDLGEDHPDYAASLNNLAELYRAMGNYAAAEPLYRRAIEIDLKALGENHPGYATDLNNLAALHDTMGNYAVAEPLYRQALGIRRQALGEADPDYAITVTRLANTYKLMGNYAAAEPLYREALEIWRKALGEDHPTYAIGLDNLAALYGDMGKYVAAEALCQQAIEIWRKAVGENHRDFAIGIDNLARLYRKMGNYAAAMPVQRQAVEIWRKMVGEAHPDFAISIDNLARLYLEMGNYAAAEPLYREAVAIRRKVLGENHPGYATGLNNLAALYQVMGDYDAAKPLLLQALGIQQALGEDHPDFATSLEGLAAVYENMHYYDVPRQLYRQVIEIRRKVQGEDHPDYAATLNKLARLYHCIRDYAAAEPLYHQVLHIQQKALGEDHPDYASSLNELAVLYCQCGRPAEALMVMERSAAIHDQMIGQIFSIGSESQRMAYLATLQVNLYVFLSQVLQYLSDSREAVQAGLELVLRRKAIGAEVLAAQRDAVLGGRYPALESKLQEWMTLRRQIAEKTLAGPGPEGPEAHQKLLAEWTAWKEHLEEELAHQIPEMNLEQKLRAANRDAVVQALPAGAVLLEFTRFGEYRFTPGIAPGFDKIPFKVLAWDGDPWIRPRYLAFVLPAGKPDNIKMVDLGEAEPIERMVAAFRSSITGGERSLRPGEALPSMSTNEGTDLRRAVFDPLVPALGGCTRLFLAPDGDLTQLPFEALPAGAGRYLIDDYQISYLTVGRDVLRFGAASSGQGQNPLVVADPDFDLGMAAVSIPTAETRPRGRQSRALDASVLHFDPLPGTHTEGEHIGARLGVQPWLKGTALEGRLKSSTSPRILHIATHGFFLEDQKRDPSLGQSGLGRLSHAMENPLLRSGLALAGANTWLQEKPLPAEAEDGILTAEDVSGLDLLDTELVVLSACETGLGQVQVGEGVFGLRRAFVLAGAKTLVMSLWKVPDRQTQELMEDFYARVLAGEGRAEALREAQLAMKSKCPELLYWGAFICQGDPGPLS
jgi:CHAT domain-containing protein/tetratricopeptide (TPR) repeat protein